MVFLYLQVKTVNNKSSDLYNESLIIKTIRQKNNSIFAIQ